MNDPYTPSRSGPLSPRRGWLAVLMSLASFGLGQFYNGQWHRGLWLFLILIFLFSPALALLAFTLPTNAVVPGIGLLISVFILVWLYSIFYAWWKARQLTDYRLRTWQKTGVYVAIFLACNCLSLLFTSLVRHYVIQPYHINSGSMMPTLQPGDYMLVDKRFNCDFCDNSLKRGELVVFNSPQPVGAVWVKRVIGLGGDRIQVIDGEVLVNGEPLPWRTERNHDIVDAAMEAITVPIGEVFLIGDNRQKSNDSRKIGTIKVSEILGKVRQLYWSMDKDGIRWDRVGSVPN